MKKSKLTHLDRIVIQDFATKLLLNSMRGVDVTQQKYLDFDIYIINLLTEVIGKAQYTKVVYKDYAKYEADSEKCLEFIHKILNTKFYKNLMVEHRSLSQVIDTVFEEYTKTHLSTLVDIFKKECQRADENFASDLHPKTH